MDKLLSVILGVGVLFVAGCSIISFKDAYPTHYTAEATTGHRVVVDDEIIIYEDYKAVPQEVYESLPNKFKVAALTDHLLVIVDKYGLIRYPNSTMIDYGMAHHSDAFKKKISELKGLGMIAYKVPGYFNIMAFIEDLDYQQVLETEHEETWGNWVKEFSDNKDTLKQIDEENSILLTDINNANVTLSNLEAQSASLQEQIAAARRNAESWRTRSFLLDEEVLPEYLQWFFDGTYVYAEDPFRTVYENQLVDVSGNGWATNNDVQNTHMLGETAYAYEQFIDRMTSPTLYYDEAKAAQIAQLTPPRLASMARSILHQATLSNTNAAGWLDSDHAMGLSIDMGMSGTNYDVRKNGVPTQQELANYGIFTSVLNDAGFVRTNSYDVRLERNHYTLSDYALREDGVMRSDPGRLIEEARLSVQAPFFESFSDSADAAGAALAELIGAATGQNEALMEQASELSEAINEKKNEILSQKNDLDEARADEKKWKKIYEEEQRRRRQERRDRTCIVSNDHPNELASKIEYQMSPLNNTVKHWDCDDWDRRC